MNWQLTLPTPDTHPEFPLWKRGFTPEDVYDLFFPRDFRFLCDPKRPSVCGRFGPNRARLWRFEFVVHPDEDGTQLSQAGQLWRIIKPFITHSGKRFGSVQWRVYHSHWLTMCA